MFSNFKALLVAGVALPALVGVAFAQGAATSNSVSPNAPSAAVSAAPSVKPDAAISTPAVKSEIGKSDTKLAPAAKTETKVEPSAKAGTTTAAPAVDSTKAAPGKTSAIAPNTTKSDSTKTSMVKQHHLKKQDVQKTGAADSSAKTIARGPAKPPKAGDIAAPGTAAQKL
jgi:hypothetical protein